jgi:hypothetical protein
MSLTIGKFPDGQPFILAEDLFPGQPDDDQRNKLNPLAQSI